MKLSTLFTINAVVATLFGLGFVIAPAQLLSLYGITLPDAGLFVARLLGSAFLAFGIITWMMRGGNAASSEVRAVLLGFLVSDVLGFAFSLWYQLQPTGANNLGWSTVLIYLLLAIGFGYIYFKKA